MFKNFIAKKIGEMVEDAILGEDKDEDKDKDKDDGNGFLSIFKKDDDKDDDKPFAFKGDKDKDKDEDKGNFFTNLFNRDRDDDDDHDDHGGSEKKTGFAGLWTEQQGGGAADPTFDLAAAAGAGGVGDGDAGGGDAGRPDQKPEGNKDTGVSDGDLLSDLMDVAEETSNNN